MQLIRDKKIAGFSCIRNATGALVDKKATVTLQFAKSTTLHQGFFIETRHCGLCRLKTDEKGCAHMAALAILSLIIPTGQAKAIPLPLAFVGSNWQKIGNFLHEWLHRSQYSVQRAAGEDFSLWRISPAEGVLLATIPNSWQNQGELLLHRQPPKPSAEIPENDCALLHSQLRLRVMSENERVLENAGNSSIGWQRDTSFWMWLARMLFTLHGDKIPEFFRDPSSSRFVLQIGRDKEGGALTLIAPRDKVWEMVRTIPWPSREAKILPAAKECYRVFFNTDDRLEVIPCLALADGRILSRNDLADQRFSAAYYLDGEGFLPTTRIPVEGSLSNPVTATAALPLLGFLQNEKTRHEPFSVAANDIPAFLDSNRNSLHHADNIVAPELLRLQVRQFPDRLVIDSFEEQGDWCYLSCHYGLGNTSISLNDILTAREKRLNCLPGKEWLQIDGSPLAWFYDLAEDRMAADGSGKIRLSYREILALTTVMPEITITIKQKPGRKRLADLLDTACWTDDATLTQAPGHLRSYQRNGLAWLNRLFRLGIGGLLADDMGLGKTHQGLALLQMAVQEGKEGLMLVVCPASVVLNWAEKIDHYYQGLSYAVYYGPQRDLNAALEQGLILTTYGVVRQDLEQLRLCSFDIILLDEIQHLKNRTTAVHQAVVALNSRVKIGLTGTPIENSLQDLRSLFDICLPGLLGSEREFHRNYVLPITEGGNTEVRDRLGRLIHPFILRRSRSQVLTELPEIIEDNRICELSDDQVSLYRDVLKGREQDLEELANDEATIPFMNILATITRLKQICCHPCLVQKSLDPEEYSSGKWDLFVELVEELLAANMKFVVFSQYTGMVELIEKHLQTAGIGFASLKGDMPVGKRQKMIGEFNTHPDCRVFCASLLAGGIGIDLTSAQAVIHYDRWWNPAREEQATARVHRMGQKNVVQVFRLITRGTLEEKIHNLISKKRSLATSLIQEDEAGIIKQMDRRQLAELFHFSPAIS
ncbi:MAG: DEAD/DEAH box helicase [Proteobacteria bacterium]|nr:DEAD/DEAH box helicase [Pseudomonadota bacterium]